MIRTYTELLTIPTFLERYEYLKLGGIVGEETFGGKRYYNQAFYASGDWKDFRREIIIRDNGCDLASLEKPFLPRERIIIHHLNPITIDDVIERSRALLDPNNVVAVSYNTHQAIHYGDKTLLGIISFNIRQPNDTCPWR